MFSPFQLGANALLFLSVNMYGVFVRVLAERSQRKAFLQARNCIEDRLRLEDENEKQVGVVGLSAAGRGVVGSMGWGAQGGEQGVGEGGTGWGAQGGEHRVGWGAWRRECGPGVRGREHKVGSTEHRVRMVRGIKPRLAAPPRGDRAAAVGAP